MVRSAFALLLLLAPAWDFAQTPTPHAARKTSAKQAPPTRWPIESMTVEGNQNYSRDQIIGVAGLKVGQLAGKSDFEAARDRIIATGLFDSVGFRFGPSQDSNGYAASFQVVEVTPVYPVQFEGLPAKPADFHVWLKSKDPLYTGKLPGTAEVLKRYTRLVQDFLTSNNQTEKVVAKLSPTGVDQFAVLFRSARPLPAVAQVNFTGNKALATALLQNKIAEVAVGVVYTEEGFRTLLDTAIRPRYEAQGRVAVAFPRITSEKALDVDGVVVTVTVDEGAEFKLGEIRLAGDYAGSSAQLLKLGKFKTGEVANFDEFASGVERIRKVLQRQGFMHAATTTERALHDKTQTVDVTIRIRPGPQFTMGKLTVEGLDLNSEAGVRKLWGIHEGKPFDGDYPDFFLNRVREDGLFENLHNTKSSIRVDEKSHTVDVILHFG